MPDGWLCLSLGFLFQKGTFRGRLFISTQLKRLKKSKLCSQLGWVVQHCPFPLLGFPGARVSSGRLAHLEFIFLPPSESFFIFIFILSTLWGSRTSIHFHVKVQFPPQTFPPSTPPNPPMNNVFLPASYVLLPTFRPLIRTTLLGGGRCTPRMVMFANGKSNPV